MLVKFTLLLSISIAFIFAGCGQNANLTQNRSSVVSTTAAPVLAPPSQVVDQEFQTASLTVELADVEACQKMEKFVDDNKAIAASAEELAATEKFVATACTKLSSIKRGSITVGIMTNIPVAPVVQENRSKADKFKVSASGSYETGQTTIGLVGLKGRWDRTMYGQHKLLTSGEVRYKETDDASFLAFQIGSKYDYMFTPHMAFFAKISYGANEEKSLDSEDEELIGIGYDVWAPYFNDPDLKYSIGIGHKGTQYAGKEMEHSIVLSHRLKFEKEITEQFSALAIAWYRHSLEDSQDYQTSLEVAGIMKKVVFGADAKLTYKTEFDNAAPDGTEKRKNGIYFTLEWNF